MALKLLSFLLPPGSGAGKVLTSDASGNGTWQTPAPAVGGQPLFIQDTAPTTSSAKYLWIKTNVNGVAGDVAFMVETGP